MNTYEAIVRAAEHIEQRPAQFRFSAGEIPCKATDGYIGCALSWVGHFLGLRGAFTLAARELLPHDPNCAVDIFYLRMDGFEREWKRSAKECAKALRAYAEAYHGDEKADPAYLKFRDELKTEKVEELVS